jgi:ribonucleoside-triphosphate reductase
VEEYAELAKESLEFKRKMVEANLAAGMFPFTRRYLKNGFKGHFSTIGLIGGHEACLHQLGKGIDEPSGLRLMRRVLNHLRGLVVRFQEETGHLYNLEATPGEGTCYRLPRSTRNSTRTSGPPAPRCPITPTRPCFPPAPRAT